MKKELGPMLIIGILILVAVGVGTGIYLLMRPEPVNVRKGVPWQDRMNRGKTGPGAGAVMPAPPAPGG